MYFRNKQYSTAFRSVGVTVKTLPPKDNRTLLEIKPHFPMHGTFISLMTSSIPKHNCSEGGSLELEDMKVSQPVTLRYDIIGRR